MGFEIHVDGFTTLDEKWQKMKRLYDSCIAAGTDYPDELDKFADEEGFDPDGIHADLDDCVEEWGDDNDYGYQVDVAKIPKNVTKIRFYASY